MFNFYISLFPIHISFSGITAKNKMLHKKNIISNLDTKLQQNEVKFDLAKSQFFSCHDAFMYKIKVFDNIQPELINQKIEQLNQVVVEFERMILYLKKVTEVNNEFSQLQKHIFLQLK